MLEAYKAALKHEQAFVRARERNFRLSANKPQQKQVRAAAQPNFFSKPQHLPNLQQNSQNFQQNSQNFQQNSQQRGGNRNYGPPYHQNFLAKGGNQNNGSPYAQISQQRDGNQNPGPSNNQRSANNTMDQDASMRSRRTVPMSGISYRTQHLYNAEGEKEQEQELSEYEEIITESDLDADHLNFQSEEEIPQGT